MNNHPILPLCSMRLQPTTGYQHTQPHAITSFLLTPVTTAEERAFLEFAPPNVCQRTQKAARVEAVFFVADGALSARKVAQLATLIDVQEANTIIQQLNNYYIQQNSAFRIERVASGYQLLTLPHLALWLGKIHLRQAELKLTPPALETLTIVAYRQPLTRADLEVIRGVQCVEMLKQLMERGLVKIAGEDNSLGKPYLYATTRKFLELFGLRSLDDLPHAASLKKPCSKAVLPVETQSQTG